MSSGISKEAITQQSIEFAGFFILRRRQNIQYFSKER
jgi:hypothetical protein